MLSQRKSGALILRERFKILPVRKKAKKKKKKPTVEYGSNCLVLTSLALGPDRLDLISGPSAF